MREQSVVAYQTRQVAGRITPCKRRLGSILYFLCVLRISAVIAVTDLLLIT